MPSPRPRPSGSFIEDEGESEGSDIVEGGTAAGEAMEEDEGI